MNMNVVIFETHCSYYSGLKKVSKRDLNQNAKISNVHVFTPNYYWIQQSQCIQINFRGGIKILNFFSSSKIIFMNVFFSKMQLFALNFLFFFKIFLVVATNIFAILGLEYVNVCSFLGWSVNPPLISPTPRYSGRGWSSRGVRGGVKLQT